MDLLLSLASKGSYQFNNVMIKYYENPNDKIKDLMSDMEGHFFNRII